MPDASTPGAILRASTSDELQRALAAARPGDEIRLAGGGGPYRLEHRGGGAAQTDRADIVVTSEDPRDPARFANIKISGASDLTFRGVAFETTAWQSDKVALAVRDAARITVTESRFQGPATGWLSNDGPYAGKAVTVTGVDGFHFAGNRIDDYTYGLQLTDVDGAAILGNAITKIQVDGIQVSESSGLRIVGNDMWDFWGAAVSRAHADFIQFWTKGASRPTTDVVIADNLMWASGFKPAQMIFVNNEKIHSFGADALAWRYQDFTISGNLIVNDNPNAIFVHGATGVDIVANAVFNKIDPADRKVGNQPWIRVLDHSNDVLIQGNVTPKIEVKNATGVVRSDNVILTYKDPSSPAHVDAQLPAVDGFMDRALYHALLTEAGLTPVPGSPDVVEPTPVGPAPTGPATGGTGATRIGDAGTVVVEQTARGVWTRVVFDEALDNPVVAMGPLSRNGADPATVRVRNVDADGFEFRLEEWSYLDGIHVAETVSWVAVEAGRHRLADGSLIEAGSATGGASDVETTFSAAFASAPAVFVQISSAANASTLAARAWAVDADGFRFRLQEEEAADGVIASERVDWIAVSRGGSALLAAGVTGETVTDQGATVGAAAAPIGGAVAFLASMQTLNGADTASLRLESLNGARAVVAVEEERSADKETTHVPEAVAWLALGADAFLV